MRAKILSATLCAVISVSSYGQDDEHDTRDSTLLSRISAGVWCPILTTRPEPTDTSGEIVDTDGDGVPDTFVENEDGNGNESSSLGCDIGLGVYLAGKRFDQGTLGLVGGLGSKSVVLGAAWIFRGQEDNSLSVAIAVGLGAPYDTHGIYTDGAGIVIGTNLSLTGSQINSLIDSIGSR